MDPRFFDAAHGRHSHAPTAATGYVSGHSTGLYNSQPASHHSIPANSSYPTTNTSTNYSSTIPTTYNTATTSTNYSSTIPTTYNTAAASTNYSTAPFTVTASTYYSTTPYNSQPHSQPHSRHSSSGHHR